MKIIKSLTFTAIAALAVALVFQTPITRAGDDHGRGGDWDHRAARVSFTKWVTDISGQPGLIATMEGVVGGGDAGHGTFTGEVLKWDTSGEIVEIVAFYHFIGSRHSFSAIVHVLQPKTSTIGVVTGVVTEGWLKGQALKGEYTQFNVGPNPFGNALPIPYFEVTLEIDRDSEK